MTDQGAEGRPAGPPHSFVNEVATHTQSVSKGMAWERHG